jgi:hypothetical protein
MRISQCLACLGTKRIVALGNIQKSCHYCHGIGYLEEPEKDLKVTLGDIMDIAKRKPKQKKKVVNETILQC